MSSQGPRRDPHARLAGRLLVVAAALLWLVFVAPMVVSSVSPGLFPRPVVDALLTASAILFVVVAVLIIWHAVALAGAADLERLWPAMVAVKIIAIPFFVANFVFWWLIVSSLLFFGVGFFIWPLAVAVTYLALLPTSAYGLAALAVLRRRQAVSTAYVVVNVILHLTFVLDIASTFVVAVRARDVARADRRPVGPALSARDPGG